MKGLETYSNQKIIKAILPKMEEKVMAKSKVDPAVAAFMRGEDPRGKRPTGNPQGVNRSEGNFRAEQMDKGLPLSPVKKKNGK